MAEEGLKIKIGADVQSAISNINDLNNTLVKTNDAAADVGTNGMKQLTQSTGKANIALTNFSRVVQDAPFGIIGIANNIDPLLTSFQNLKKETGSSGAAFKALASALTGPAGIAIAVSAVTSLLVAFGPKIVDFVNGVSESEKALQGIASETAQAFRKAQLEFEKLSNIIKSSSSTYEQQQNALNKVNNSLSAYGLEIKNVADFQKNASQIGVLFAQIKQEEARGLALAAESAKEYAKQVVAQSIAEQANARIKATKGLGELEAAWIGLVNSIKEYNANSDIKDAVKNQNVYNNSINQSNSNLQKLLGQLGKISGVTAKTTESQNKSNNATSKAATNIDEIAELIKRYGEEIKGINWDEQNRQIDGTKKRLDAASETLKTLYLKGVKETSDAWVQVKDDFDKYLFAFESYVRDKRLKEINEDLRDLGNSFFETLIKQQKSTQTLIKLSSKWQENYKNATLVAADLTKRNKELADTLTNQISPVIESLFLAPLEGKNIFDVLQDSVKSLVSEIGRLIIKQAIYNALSKAFPTVSAFGIMTGSVNTGKAYARGDLFSFLLGRGR